jgi:hypothetical protein
MTGASGTSEDRAASAPPEVIYTVDDNDNIIAVNSAWSAFAGENDGTQLLPPAILGRALWDFIKDDTTIHIYQRLFARVRAGIGPVKFAFRCDAPTKRRLLEMNIAKQLTGTLKCVVRSLRVEDRPAVPAFESAKADSDELLRVCGWCKRTPDANGEWLEIEQALLRLALFQQTALPVITHGICEDCQCVMTAALEDAALAGSGDIKLGDFVSAPEATTSKQR